MSDLQVNAATRRAVAAPVRADRNEEEAVKLTLLPEKLTAALAVASKLATGGIYRLPVLQNVALRAFDGELIVSATSVDRRVDLKVPARIEEEGAYTVDPSRLDAVLAICQPGEPLTLTLKKNRLGVACGRVKAELAGISFDEFPVEVPVSGGTWLRLPATTLAHGLTCVLHAISPSDQRPIFTGVEFRRTDDVLRLSTGDGYHFATWSVAGVEGDLQKVVIPGRALRLMLPSLAYDEIVTLDLSEYGQMARFSLDGVTWTFQALEGEMPLIYETLSRKQASGVVTYERAELDRALRLCTGLDRNQTGKDAVRRALLKIGAESTEVVARDTIDEHSGAMEISSVVESGEPRSTSLNAAFLRDAVNAIGGDRVALEIPSEAGNLPVIARAPGTCNGHLQAVVQLVKDARLDGNDHA